MFNNARTYNVEGSVVYVDADEMEKVFNETFNRLTIGSGLPGAETGETSSAVVDDDDDEGGSTMNMASRAAPEPSVFDRSI